MGSAPVRRGFEARMLSSQRRGAPVGPGMPGVYAVRRSRSGQQSTPVPSGPPPAIGEWTQPDDVEVDTVISGVFRSDYGTPGSGVTPFSVRSENLPTEAQTACFANSADMTWQVVSVVLRAADLSAGPVSPSLPPGATGVEYESPSGLLLTAAISGTVLVTKDPQLPDPPVTEVWEVLLTDLDPGEETTNVPGLFGPSQTVAGNPVYTHTGTSPGSFTTAAQDFPPEQVVGWRVSEIHSLDESAPTETIGGFGDEGGTYFVTLEGTTTGSQLDVTYTYRPPRYRFTF